MVRAPKDSVVRKHARAHKVETAKKLTKLGGHRAGSRAGVSLTSGQRLKEGSMKRSGRQKKSEAPGPKYTPVNQQVPPQEPHLREVYFGTHCSR